MNRYPGRLVFSFVFSFPLGVASWTDSVGIRISPKRSSIPFCLMCSIRDVLTFFSNPE
jgi:hypothetical protein